MHVVKWRFFFSNPSFILRLLREMGWRQDHSGLNGDDQADEPPLTDDEIREFFTRNKRRGLLQGVPSITHRTIAFRDALLSWSPSSKQLRRGNDRQTAPESVAEAQSPRYSTDSQFSSLSDSD